VVSDSRSLEMLNLFQVDRCKPTTSSRQEAMYRLCAESHVDENLFRFEYVRPLLLAATNAQFLGEHTLTIQLLSKDDDFGDDSITSEEKWSLYVDHFVQLSTTEGGRLKRREPFLKRTLPDSIADEVPSNVETRSGLELKICLNTYKIFFVNNTEDFFVRRGVDRSRRSADRRARHLKFRAWLDSANGWRKFIPSKQNTEGREREFEEWVLGDDVAVSAVSDEFQSFRRFAYTKPALVGEAAAEDDEMDVDQE
jgi:paired amphipathic helix protein Sin3a